MPQLGAARRYQTGIMPLRRPALAVVVAVLAVLAVGTAAPPARAGTFHVYACYAGGGAFGNAAFRGHPVPGIVVDRDCTPPAALIGFRIDPGSRIPNGTAARLQFTAAPGTRIADFSLDRHLQFAPNPPAAGLRPPYALYRLGDQVFAGAGDYLNPVRNGLAGFGSWYGHPAGNAVLTRRVNSLRQFGALAGYAGDARSLSIEVGCFPRQTDCSSAGGRVFHVLHGADVTLSDLQAPGPTVSAEGLLSGGPREGTEPVVVSATDNVGIGRIELHDITDPAAPQLVGAEDYTQGTTDDGRRCAFTVARPCPELARELVAAGALKAGRRQLVVRTIDAGQNVVDRGPFAVDVVSPADRGPLNGTGATETGSVSANFSTTRRTTRTVDYGTRVSITGRLRNAAGQPIANAELRLLSRDDRSGAQVVLRDRVRTGPDGGYRFRYRAFASRRLEVGWASHVNDVRFAASDRLTLAARAGATLSASTRSPRVGRRMGFSGRLLNPAPGVSVILQGRAGGEWFTVADTQTGDRGRFRLGYRFRAAASRGRSFAFRARVRGSRAYPFATGYSPRVTVRVR